MAKGSGKQKRPAVAAGLAAVPPQKRVPSKQPALAAISKPDGLLQVRFGKFDVNGPWCLSKATPEDLVHVLQVIASVESMRPLDVFNGQIGKDYTAAALPNKDARDRLVELHLDDRDCISRLRVGGQGRLYGFRQDLDFWALWWDPDHKIWPSTLRHT